MTLQDYKGLDIYAIFPNFNDYSVEERVEIRELLINEKKSYAHNRLVQKYGMDCDGDNCGHFNYSAGAIAGERLSSGY